MRTKLNHYIEKAIIIIATIRMAVMQRRPSVAGVISTISDKKHYPFSNLLHFQKITMSKHLWRIQDSLANNAIGKINARWIDEKNSWQAYHHFP